MSAMSAMSATPRKNARHRKAKTGKRAQRWPRNVQRKKSKTEIMAIAVLREPYKELHGSICKSDAYYVRMFRGRCVFQHKPRKRSEKQRQMREAFGRLYGTAHKRQGKSKDT